MLPKIKAVTIDPRITTIEAKIVSPPLVGEISLPTRSRIA